MPYELPLPKGLKKQGWKVKIREKERLEPPHVTVMCRAREWRIGLRDGAFLYPGGSAKEIDADVWSILESNWEVLRAEWDAKYPSNRVSSEEVGDE